MILKFLKCTFYIDFQNIYFENTFYLTKGTAIYVIIVYFYISIIQMINPVASSTFSVFVLHRQILSLGQMVVK